MKLSFLGPEFLTWLYFHTDQVPEKIAVGRRVSLKPLGSEEHKVVIASPTLEDSGEFLQAIRAGAHVASMAFDLVVDDRVHSFTLHALDGSLSGVKTQGAEADIIMRMSNLDEIEDTLSRIFEKFLELRLGQTFVSQSLRLIRESVSEGLKARLP